MKYRALCNSHFLMCVFLVSMPVSAQVTSDDATEIDPIATWEEPIEEGLEVADDTAQEGPSDADIAPQQIRQRLQTRSVVRDYTDKYLAILGLLFLWLLTRKENERKEQRSRPARKTPVTAEELGRAVYSVTRSTDLTGFRTLHIDGKEAGVALGVESATKYLQDRTQNKLKRDLHELSEKVPLGAQYRSSKIENDKITITLITSTGEIVEIDAGEVVQVGAALRLK